MRSPCRVEFVSDLDRNEDPSHTFPGGLCRAFAMGSPVSGCVAYFCALDRTEGFFHPSILSCFAMGSPCGSSVIFSHSIVTKSVFLQDGVTPVGSGSNDLISSEGITTAGLLEELFLARPRGVFVSSFGRPVCSEAGWVPHSVVFASGEDSVCIPLANGSQRRSGSWPFFFWPCCLSSSPGGLVSVISCGPGVLSSFVTLPGLSL